MHAHALLMLGRVREGQVVLDQLIGPLEGDVDPGDDREDRERALATLLRRQPMLYGPLLRERMGARFSALAYRAWVIALMSHADEPAVQREILELLDELVEPQTFDPRATGQLIALHLDRADVLIDLHQLEAARRELRHVALEVDAGQLDRARARVQGVLEASSRRMYLEEQLRVHPRLSRVVEPPAAR